MFDAKDIFSKALKKIEKERRLQDKSAYLFIRLATNDEENVRYGVFHSTTGYTGLAQGRLESKVNTGDERYSFAVKEILGAMSLPMYVSFNAPKFIAKAIKAVCDKYGVPYTDGLCGFNLSWLDVKEYEGNECDGVFYFFDKKDMSKPKAILDQAELTKIIKQSAKF